MKAPQTTTAAEEKSTDNTLDDRTESALAEYMTVLDDVGRAQGAEGLYVVVSASGSEYLVDARDGACECPDHEHRGAHCKHLRRVGFATGEAPIPAAADKVDPQLGDHVAGTPRVAAADGGAIAEESESADADGRPDDCDCWDADLSVPCWPCYRDGFEEQNPAEPGADEDEEEGA